MSELISKENLNQTRNEAKVFSGKDVVFSSYP